MHSPNYEEPPAATDFIPIVRIFIILFSTLAIVINYFNWDLPYYYICFIFCAPLVLNLILYFVSILLDKMAKFHSLIPEHAEMLILQVVIILFIFSGGPIKSGLKILLLLPVILYSLRFGAKTGYISSLINTFVSTSLFFINEEPINFLHIDLVLIPLFFLFSWLLGEMGAAERSLRKQLTEFIKRDELTGLYNRRFFQEQLGKTMQEFHKSEGKLGLIMLDLDNFSMYNEILGFYSGDMVLKRVAETIQLFLEESDFAARFGGDTFVILTPARETTQIIAKAEKIRKAIEAFHSVIPGSDRKVSASLGVALFPDQAKNMQELIQKANEALDKVKITRGNRVQLYYSIFDRISGEKLKTEKEFLDTIKTLMAVIHAKDKFTYGHSERVLVYAQLLCKSLQLSRRETIRVEYAALLHDIGKIEIDKDILNEPHPLPEEKWNIYKQHPLWSAEIIKPLKKTEALLPIIIHHHERFDGSGYPDGLKGEEIPLGARILAVANAFDLMTTGRIKDKGRTIDQSIDLLLKKKGTHYDPLIIDHFVSCLNKYKTISRMLEWPRDLCKLVPAGYLPGFLLTGGHYGEFYSGNAHLAIKAVSYSAAGVLNNERILYYFNEETEKIFLEKLPEYLNVKSTAKFIIKENQLTRWENLKKLLYYIEKRAMLEFETKKNLKSNLDETTKNNFTSLRVILDTSSLSLTPKQTLIWEKNLAACIKGLDLLFICFYDFTREPLELCRILYDLHDQPLCNEEKGSEIPEFFS